MISNLDIWRAAQVMVKRYGDGAATEAATRADEFLDQGMTHQASASLPTDRLPVVSGRDVVGVLL